MKRIFVKERLIGLEYGTRLRLKFFREKARGLINFVAQLEYFHEDKWKVVVRYDCFHGFFHRDFYSPSGRKRAVEDFPTGSLRGFLVSSVKDLREKRELYIKRFLGDSK